MTGTGQTVGLVFMQIIIKQAINVIPQPKFSESEVTFNGAFSRLVRLSL
jgi:hypothetical protein